MPTYDELRREAVWNAEVVPTELAHLARRLRDFWELPRNAIGTIGDRFHLSGYHRSRNWLRSSMHARPGLYSISETAGNVSGGNGDEVSAMDITVTRGLLITVCRNLDVAVRAGRLEKITEWYGNTDGDNHVDGYDNVVNRVESSDPRHLWHLHMSFDRGRVRENHDDVFRALTNGTIMLSTPTVPTAPGTSQGWTDAMIRNAPIVKAGHEGWWTRTVQALCCARGVTIAIDGNFGPRTTSAVKSVQRHSGSLAVDGIVGPQTWPVLFGATRAA